MTKHIFVTGGVVSSLGKGLTSASIGMLLEKRGLKIRMQKLDPYINVDPGTMSPYQHGEVYVLDDGSETDLDLGHYERFTNSLLNRDSNFTTGQIYQTVIHKERRGEFLGQTVQVIPHITNEIKAALAKPATDDVDVVITEIGGTVGDIESQPFLEAIRQFALDIGKENCLYIHLTLLPYLKAAGELKTKPTQHSVGDLRQIGIQPDILICRTERSMSSDESRKIALFCNVPVEAVIEEKDKDFSIYEVPMSLVDHGLDQLIVRKLNLPAGTLDLDDWRDLLHQLRNPEHEISIAVVGKYAEHRDAYKSIYESLDHAGIARRAQVRIQRIHSEAVEREGPERLLGGVDGILVPGGFGERGIEGKVDAVRFAREKGIPFFGNLPGNAVCGGRVRAERHGPRGSQLDRIRQRQPPPGHLPAGRTEIDHRQGWHDASGCPSGQIGPRERSISMLRQRGDLRAAPSSLRVQQRVPPAIFGPRHEHCRHQPGRGAGRNRRNRRPPVVRGRCSFIPSSNRRPTSAHPLFAGFIGGAIKQHAQTGGTNTRTRSVNWETKKESGITKGGLPALASISNEQAATGAKPPETDRDNSHARRIQREEGPRRRGLEEPSGSRKRSRATRAAGSALAGGKSRGRNRGQHPPTAALAGVCR